MNHGGSIWRGTLIGLFITRVALPAYAQDDGAAGAPTRAEFNKLQAEIKEHRQLIIQMMQTEQQRYDMLLRLMQGQAGVAAVPPVAVPSASEPATTGGGDGSPRRAHAESEHRAGSIEGKVTVRGGDVGDVYVYVENVKGPAVRNKSIEIRQEGKQFAPRIAVVQPGTNVVFPNFDTVYHNVFSNSSRNSFDLGTYRAGDKPRSVTLTTPGVVEVFCNMHQKMSADILVVPNPLYTKVKADGSFRLDNVPVGARRVVAWSPMAKPALQKVEVTGGNTQASFVLERSEGRAHTNKVGQAYGSYRD
jgi:plastocyanin